jgi:hypothetical protein
MNRREFLITTAALTGSLATGCKSDLPNAGTPKLSRNDNAFLKELQRATFQFFNECAHSETGLVKDRSRADHNDERTVASIAATGFGLAALCIAAERGWIPHQEAESRALRTLRFLENNLPHERGFYFHFVNWKTGARVWNCELSSIDTALLLAGVLTCRAYFHDAKIHSAATTIYDRIDWRWMAQGGLLLGHGWKPETGFLKSKWDTYCEHMLLYLLAIGANQHALPPESWKAWRRPQFEYHGIRYINPKAPLFVHQFSHAWFDFRNMSDGFADYFQNSIKATRAHHQFCLDLRNEFPHFSENLWGITSSDSAHGYVAWGGPPRQGPLDGTIVPCAAGGSLPFLPNDSVACLRNMRERFGKKIWRRYGFVDAFNPATGWVAPDVIGIDAGITLLMAENLRTGFVWNQFMRNPEARRGMRLAGFR